MESLKDLARKKALNIFSSLIFVSWIIACCLLGGGFILIEISQSKSDISCDGEFKDKDEKELIREECFDKYEKEYNKFTLYGFVFINCFILAMVTIIYSLCLQSRVGELEIPNQNVEEQPQRSRVLFTAYCCQLAATIVLAAVFIIVLQIYASTDFPSNFECDPFEQGSNSSAFSSTNGSQAKTDIYPCRNRRATKKLRGSVALTVFNGILAFFAVIELVWIFSRARNGMQFMDDPQFYADHLRSNREQEQPIQVEVILSDRRSTQGFEAVNARSLLDQQPLIEPTPLTPSERTPEQQAELQAKLESLKDCIRKRTEQLEDLNPPIRPRPGEGQKPKDLKLDQIFVKLVIHNRIANYDFPKDRREQLKVFPKPKSNQSYYVPWQEIIDGNNKHILLVGRPGIGKTILSTKLLRGSAFNEFTRQNFDAAFLVKFRCYNSTKKYLDLRELLSRSETVRQDLDDEVWNYIITNPTKVLMIFDGIDEFNARSAISEDDSDFRDSDNDKMPLHRLYKKIASGKVLKGATVITTTRPTASSCVKKLEFNTVLEILGFTREEIEEYVKRFTAAGKNPEAEKKAIWEHISTNTNLFTLCYVPVNCFIICSCLSWFHSYHGELPTKLTEIYSTALKIFYFRHSDKFRMAKEAHDHLFLEPFNELPNECKNDFKRLGEIASLGIEEGRLLFTSEEVGGLKDCGLLHRLPDRLGEKGFNKGEPQYCFIHLTFQEFLTAKHLVDTETKAHELQQFITDHIYEGTWQLVLQFVAGLLANTDEAKVKFCERLMEFLPTLTSAMVTELGREDVQPGMTRKSISDNIWPCRKIETDLAVTICKCLYELDVKEQISIPREMKKMCVWLSDNTFAPADCTAILHFLKNFVEKFTLCVRCKSMSDFICMEIKKWIVESDFSGGDCKLEGLEIAYNNLGDEEAKLLSDAIIDGKCKLPKLYLRTNNIKEEGVKHLSAAIQDVNNNLTVLDLACNKIGDKGAKFLSNAIKHGHCKLTKLLLEFNNIREEGAKHLRDALKDANNHLTLLDLASNSIKDKGAKCLSEALKDVHCELTVLNLARNDVGDEGAECLSNALRDVNCNLSKLSLEGNRIGEKGAEHLSGALQDANLTELYLKFNLINEREAKHLRDAYIDSHCEIII